MLKRREPLGWRGIGKNIAIPHCRARAVNRLRVAFGRKLDGIDFNAIDGKPVHYFFLIVAPPLEVSNQYLPVLGKIDRKSTRLNSSHSQISYAVFCLKKKKNSNPSTLLVRNARRQEADRPDHKDPTC